AGIRLCGVAASTLLWVTEVLGFVLGARTGRGRTGRLGGIGRTRAGMTRAVRAAVPELAGSGRLGLCTGRLAATVCVTG
ncbi:MAG TPA: hypothetical protein VNB58_02710, partial [Gaiellaceae bacterium]|nr:hypothetical protein [Gaiellaceae bacterium]